MPEKKDAYDIRPQASADKAPTGVDWQKTNEAVLKKAVAPEVLAKFVESAAAADALLAQVGGAYSGDPLVLTQIANVTQLVMTPRWDVSGEKRRLWVAALERTAAKTGDDYVRTFCRQQLDLCK